MAKTRYQELYDSEIRPTLKKELAISNIMDVPKIKKVVLNVGVKEAVSDSRVIKNVTDVVSKIVGQLAVKTVARKSIAGFKIREGMPLGVMVTLRGKTMFDFLDRLINLALPKVKDFQGVSDKLDGRGNYNLGIKEWTIFPEAESGIDAFVSGLNITIQTTAKNDADALLLLKKFGMPFRRKVAKA
jgi:large subunit ribosomal protein L5